MGRSSDLADRIERAEKIERGEIRFTSDDAGYASILKAFDPPDRALIVAALRRLSTIRQVERQPFVIRDDQ